MFRGRFTQPHITPGAKSVFYLGQRFSRRHVHRVHSPLLTGFISPVKLFAGMTNVPLTVGASVLAPSALLQMAGSSLELPNAASGGLSTLPPGMLCQMISALGIQLTRSVRVCFQGTEELWYCRSCSSVLCQMS